MAMLPAPTVDELPTTFTARELAWLAFVRWLYARGLLREDR